jgi:predicted ABC-type ATPase
VRRRFSAGLRNFFSLYQQVAESWLIYDNSGPPPTIIVAAGRGRIVTQVDDQSTWAQIKQARGESSDADRNTQGH